MSTNVICQENPIIFYRNVPLGGAMNDSARLLIDQSTALLTALIT